MKTAFLFLLFLGFSTANYDPYVEGNLVIKWNYVFEQISDTLVFDRSALLIFTHAARAHRMMLEGIYDVWALYNDKCPIHAKDVPKPHGQNVNVEKAISFAAYRIFTESFVRYSASNQAYLDNFFS